MSGKRKRNFVAELELARASDAVDAVFARYRISGRVNAGQVLGDSVRFDFRPFPGYSFDPFAVPCAQIAQEIASRLNGMVNVTATEYSISVSVGLRAFTVSRTK